jgi:hypothetical protein
MPDYIPIYQQDAAIQLMGEFMRRDDLGKRMRNRRTPVLLFTGPRGIGKTQLLKQMTEALQDIPFAYIDCAGRGENSLDILVPLAFSLSRHSAHYGKLRFPRLITGTLVVGAKELDLNANDRDAACEQVKDLLSKAQKTSAILDDAVGVLIDVGGPLAMGAAGVVWGPAEQNTGDVAKKYTAEYVRKFLGSTSRGRQLLLGDGQAWYGRQRRAALEQLVDLRLAADRASAQAVKGDDDARKVTRRLWAAFLADLRADFGARKRAGRQTHNCIALLDNADDKSGRSFLLELMNARAQDGEKEPDPLTVVATSRGDLTARVAEDSLTALADASYSHYQRRPDTDQHWYAIQPPPLSWTETEDIVNALRLSQTAGPARLVTAVHAFTGGHRGATHTLLTTVGKRRKDPEDLLASLGAVDQRELGGDRTAEEAMLEALLGPLSDPAAAALAADLTTCSAARTRDAAMRLSMNSQLMQQPAGARLLTDFVEFWSSSPGRPAQLQQPLRRLLLRKLARRDATADADWTTVHAWLCDDSAGDFVGKLYHTLALADEDHPDPVAIVVDRLLEREIDPAAGWLNRIAQLTAAPNRLLYLPDPAKQVTQLTQWAGRDRDRAAAGRLVVCSWLGADPLRAQHWRWLLNQMAGDLEALAPRAQNSGTTALRDAARRYRDTVDGSWPEVERFWTARTALVTETSEGANS